MAQINKPTDYFNTVTYTGTGATDNSQTVGFQPDWIWFKNRSVGDSHALVDSVRGRTKFLLSDATNSELTGTTDLESFDANGFTVGVPDQVSSPNRSTSNIVAWNWLAGGTASDNTDGSITSSVSANTTSGFSIVKWTGTGGSQTIGHGLGVKPEIIIIKNTDKTCAWVVYNKTIDATDYLSLNDNGARTDYAGYFADTEPTSSVFTVGTDTDACGASGHEVIAYCFNSVKGYSKISSYTANGNANGTFVYTGFKPAFVMIKQVNTARSWHIYDSVRTPNNEINKYLAPDQSQAESPAFTDNNEFDFLSNGFKLRSSNTGSNDSGGTYIYMAFAAEPLVGTNKIPATAR